MIVLSNGEPQVQRARVGFSRLTAYEQRKSVDSKISDFSFLSFSFGKVKIAAIACPCNYALINDDEASRVEGSLKKRSGFAKKFKLFLARPVRTNFWYY